VTLHSRLLDLCKSADAALGIPLARACGGARRPLPDDPRDVLAVRLWGLGNLVLLAPLFALAGERRVRLLTLARNAGFMAAHFPRVELLLLPEPPSPVLPLALAAVRRGLARDPPQVIVDCEQFLRLPALLVRGASGAPLVGMDTPGQGRLPLLDRAIRYDPTRHVADTFAALVRAAGLPVDGTRRIPLAVPASEREALRARLRRAGLVTGAARRPLVVLHPGSGDHFPGRRWPPERFAALADRLAERGAQLVLTGVVSEARLLRLVAGAARVPLVNLCGQLDARALVALLADADLLVANDTGPVHLADALGTPTLALYGPNTPYRYGPSGPRSLALYADLPCSPCLDDRTMKRSSCRHHACMLALPVDHALAAASLLLRSRTLPEDVAADAPSPVEVRDACPP
jgi:ADP-heptose:LPS heptosyltransferase